VRAAERRERREQIRRRKTRRDLHRFETCQDPACPRLTCRAYRQGYADGYEAGSAAGYAAGHSVGYAEGHADGYAEGSAAAGR
jgi:hypothetical protein